MNQVCGALPQYFEFLGPHYRADGSSLSGKPKDDAIKDLDSEEKENEPVSGFTIPGCGDKTDIDDKPAPIISVTCVADASKVPNNIFRSESHKVYKDFCSATTNNHHPLQWTADVHGNLQDSPPHHRMLLKRVSEHLSPRDNNDPVRYKYFKFKLDWAPNKPFNPEDCYLECDTAFSALAKTADCGQKGEAKDLMAKSGQIKADCGTLDIRLGGATNRVETRPCSGQLPRLSFYIPEA